MGKKRFKDRFLDFFDTKGFYVVVIVCLLVIGVSIYTIVSTDFTKYDIENTENTQQSTKINNIQKEIPSDTVTYQDNLKNKSNNTKDNTKGNTNQTLEIEEPKEDIKTQGKVNQNKTNPYIKTDDKKSPQNTVPKKKLTSNNNTNEPVNEEVEVINPVDFKPIFPVSGKVIKNYTDDSLEYSKTLDEWTDHQGIDIQSQNQADVKACFDGTVIEIGVDPLYGNYVMIDHGDGYVSKYCNLKDLKLVQLGEIVTQGQKIGEIGSSANIEYMDPPHLHFELIVNGDHQNPLKYLPKQ